MYRYASVKPLGLNTFYTYICKRIYIDRQGYVRIYINRYVHVQVLDSSLASFLYAFLFMCIHVSEASDTGFALFLYACLLMYIDIYP